MLKNDGEVKNYNLSDIWNSNNHLKMLHNEIVESYLALDVDKLKSLIILIEYNLKPYRGRYLRSR